MVPYPKHFEQVPFDGPLNHHHADIQPALLHTRMNIYMPWMVFCPECGERRMGTTQQMAIDHWQAEVIDQGGSEPDENV